MTDNKILAKYKKILAPKNEPEYKGRGHSRYEIKNKKYQSILIYNAPYIFTCDEEEEIRVLKNYSIAIENGVITKVAPARKIVNKNFDLVYDAGKRGGIVITPGLINAHSHPPMYLMRSAMMLDEGEKVDETIAAMPLWEKSLSEDDFTVSAIGDLTEQQKFGITTTLSHYGVFYPMEYAVRLTKHNLINALSVASNTHPENTPELIESLLKQKNEFHSKIAVALHYLHKANPDTLAKIKRLIDENNILFTCHMAESEIVAKTCKKIYKMRETKILEKYGLLNSNTIISHAIYVNGEEIKQLSKNKVGIVHLPTSNTIHKSGIFPFWKYYDAGAFPQIALGTDGVVSKSRLDILTEAYQTRLTHLYTRTVKFGRLFRMMTSNGTRILKLNKAGKILPGFEANLAFWKLKDRGFIPYDKDDPITLIGNIITHHGRTARDLMIKGRFIIRDRKHILINESKLLEIIQKKHTEMRKRVARKNKSY